MLATSKMKSALPINMLSSLVAAILVLIALVHPTAMVQSKLLSLNYYPNLLKSRISLWFGLIGQQSYGHLLLMKRVVSVTGQ